MQTPSRPPQFDPASVVLPEAFDPRALLSVWCIRKSVFPLIWVGIASAAVADRLDDVDIRNFDTFTEALQALVSPLAGVIVALAMRLASSILGAVLAYRVAGSVEAIRRPFESGHARAARALIDRVYVARAFRSLRWTKAARQVASGRIGPSGRHFELADRMLSVANVVLLAMMIPVVAIIS